jgi:integrase
MGIYRRFSGVYWLSLTVHGKQVFESCGTHSKKLAKTIFAIRQAEIVQGRYHPLVATKSPLLSVWSEEFLGTVRDLSTKRRYFSSIQHLKAFFQKARLSEITPRDIEHFKKQRLGTGVRSATVNRDLAVLRRMLKLATQQRLIAETPFTGVEFLEERKQRRLPYVLTWKDQDRLLAVAPPRIRIFVVLGTETGMRTGEMLRLRWGDVDLENGNIHVKKSKTISGIRAVPISCFLKAELLRWRDLLGPDFSEWVFPQFSNTRHRLQGGRKSWASALKKAGIPYFRQYDLRHCFASRLSAAGASPLTVAQMLGHSSTGIVQTYAKVLDDTRRTAINGLERLREQSLQTVSSESQDQVLQ